MIEERAMTRHDYQRMLDKHKQRRLRRRRARVHRVRFWRSVRTVQFWIRVVGFAIALLAIVFWAKFAFVYRIPPYAAQGPLENVRAYVAVKPWWFGPPAFDLQQDMPSDSLQLNVVTDPYGYLLLRLGRYSGIVEHPNVIWAKHNA